MKSSANLFFISLIISLLFIFSNCSSPSQQPQKQTHLNTNIKTFIFTVKGMTCQSCAGSIKMSLMSNEGIDDVEIVWDKPSDNITVSFNPDKVSLEQIKKAIKAGKKEAEVVSYKEV